MYYYFLYIFSYYISYSYNIYYIKHYNLVNSRLKTYLYILKYHVIKTGTSYFLPHVRHGNRIASITMVITIPTIAKIIATSANLATGS